MGKVCEFYNKKKVFVTGGTGFCGKVLIEKLLRSCESVDKIYVLVRRKKNASLQMRRVDFVDHFIFDRIRQTNDAILQKIIFVGGDISVDGLDLSPTNEQTLIDEVNIIFHCAATVKFNEPLKVALNTNTVGTLRVLELARKMKNLEVFSYMSTAFCQSHQIDLEEKFYPSKLDVFGLIEEMQQMNNENLNNLEKKLLKKTKHANTYTLSKALAEDVVQSFSSFIPIVVIRPSMVFYAMSEPFKGFIEGLHSATAVISGSMMGLVRSIHAMDDVLVKFTPVDFLSNATIVTAWKRGSILKSGTLVYNCTVAEDHPLLWKHTFRMFRESFYEFALYKNLLWVPNVSFTTNYAWHITSLLLFQLLPAFIADFVSILLRKQPFLSKIQLKIIKNLKALQNYSKTNYNFETKKLRELFAELDDGEKINFCFDHKTIDWKYHHNGIMQIRRLLLNEDESTIPKGQAKLRKLYFADLLIKTLFSGAGLLFFRNLVHWLISDL